MDGVYGSGGGARKGGGQEHSGLREERGVRGPGVRRALVLTCVLVALAGSAPAGAYAAGREGAEGHRAEDAVPAPVLAKGAGDKDLEKLRRRIARLNDRAETATDAYNAAEERAKKQRKQVQDLARKVKALRRELAGYRKTAGALARSQYRGGGLPAEARLVLRKDPDRFLRDLSLARKGQQATKGLLTTVARKRSRLDAYAQDASAKWHKLEAERERKGKAKKRIEDDLKQSKSLESHLAEDQLKRLRELEAKAAEARQARWLKSGVLDEIHGRASDEGKRAIAYATEQMGKDYEWGAEGPRTYDCSGLTMRAWQAAGEQIPRTSQEQWKRLPRVPVEKMRPGDLIIYKHDASHVGMYVGGGEMINAPRTGRQISLAGAGSMPIRGVVRPDK